MKTVCAILALLICIIFASSCSNTTSGSTAKAAMSASPSAAAVTASLSPSATASVSPVSPSAVISSPTPSLSASASGQTAVSGKIGDFTVEIVSYVITKDFNGNPAIVINFSWTNGSQASTNYASAFATQVLQNGTSCHNASINDSSVYDPGNYMKDVNAGSSLTIQLAFALPDATSPVKIVIGPAIDTGNNPPTIMQTFDITKK